MRTLEIHSTPIWGKPVSTSTVARCTIVVAQSAAPIAYAILSLLKARYSPLNFVVAQTRFCSYRKQGSSAEYLPVVVVNRKALHRGLEGGESNREIVSFRACDARGSGISSNFRGVC